MLRTSSWLEVTTGKNIIIRNMYDVKKTRSKPASSAGPVFESLIVLGSDRGSHFLHESRIKSLRPQLLFHDDIPEGAGEPFADPDVADVL